MKILSLMVSLFILMGLLLIGCVAYVPPPPDGYYAPGPPPAPMVEVRPAVPYPEAVWIGGYWAHHGGAWAWRGGYWDRRPHPGAAWSPGYWHHYGNRGWGYRHGYWR
jgi:hypothetical protein